MADVWSRVVSNPQWRHTCSRSASCLGFASPHGQRWLVPRGSTDKNLRPALSALYELRPQQPDLERSIARRFFGHHGISLPAVAVVAPGIAGVYWAAESHALTFQRG